MRILFINPPTGIYFREDRCQIAADNLLATPAARTPLDLAYPAGIARTAGCRCMIRDYPAMGLGWEIFRADLKSFAPDILFISTTLFTIEDDLRAAHLARTLCPGILTIAKGPYFMNDPLGPFAMCPDLDVAIPGETEMVMADIAAGRDLSGIDGIIYRRNGEPVQNPARPMLEDLDRMGLPARDLLDNSLYIRPDTMESQTTILTNRGCPHKCIYCLARKVSGQQDRWRSVESVAEEVRQCVEVHHIRNFFFEANEFTLRRDWTSALCDRLIAMNLPISWVSNSRVDTIDEELAHQMKAAGCWLISFGIESGSQEMLRKMRKGITLDQSRAAIASCRRAGILSYGYFVLGLPWETRQTIEATIHFSIELDLDFAEFYIAYPFKGTELHTILHHEGLLLGDGQARVEFGDRTKPSHRSQSMSAEEIASFAKVATRRFYLRPRYILKQLARVRDPKVLKNYLRYGIKMVGKLLPGR